MDLFLFIALLVGGLLLAFWLVRLAFPRILAWSLRHKLVALGSPVWLFRPAPPLWAFVASHRFDGSQVLLFNTFNSRRFR